MLKVWIVGANGQLGSAMNKVLRVEDYEIFNTDIDELDIRDTDAVIAFGEINRPDIIINCSGISDLEYCIHNKEEAFAINALGPRNLCIVARKLGAKVVQISTDDVFSGDHHRPYNEFDDLDPKTVYGQSKKAGEDYVKEFTHKHFIIRSNWIYGNNESNFVNQVIKAVKNNEVLKLASQEVGSPTSAMDLARAIMALMNTNEYGTYHITSNGVCSRMEFAKEVASYLEGELQYEDIGANPHRPNNAVLDNFVLRIIDGYKMPDWKSSLEEFMEEYNG